MPFPDPFVLSDLANGSPVPDYRLSDATAHFVLISIDLDESLPIGEPVGWDGAEWVLERDPDMHGVNFEFTGDEATLTFDEPIAVDFIQNVYKSFGPKSDLRLSWYLSYASETLPLQTLQLKLDKRSIKGRVLTITGERLSLHPQIRTRWDTTLSMDAKQAIVNDANLLPIAITPPAPTQLLLHSQHIKQVTTFKDIDKALDTGLIDFPNSGAAIIQGGSLFSGPTDVHHDFYYALPLDPTRATANEVETFQGSLFGVDVNKPEDFSMHVFKTKAAGTYHVELSVDMQADAQLLRRSVSISPPKITTFSFRCVVVAAGVTYDVFTPLVGVRDDRWLNPQRKAGKIALDLELPANEPVYMYGVLHIETNRDNWRGTSVSLNVFSCTLSISANTYAPASSAPAYPILDVLRHFTACLTGRANAVQSTYYSLASGSQPVDGGGAHRFLLNGYALRGFLQKPAQSSLQDVLTSIQSLDAIGVSYRPTSSGEVMVVEPVAFFYNDTEVLKLTSYTIIEEATDARYLHPSATFGYEKYPDSGTEVLDEFNTKQEYLLPGKAGTPYDQVCSLIASGYAIEQTRRVQFTDKPNDSTTYDDDLFVICANQVGSLTQNNSSVTLTGTFQTVAGKASLTIEFTQIPTWLAKGASIQIAGSTSNDGIYKIVDFQSRLLNGLRLVLGRKANVRILSAVLTLDRTVASETGSITLSIGKAGTWQAETDTAFKKVQGVLDPKTTYNLRLAPHFNFLRHGRYLSGAMVYDSGSEPIRVQFTKNNAKLRTWLKEEAPGDLNIDIRRMIDHSGTTYVADIRHPLDPLWFPETIKVETKLTLDMMLYLRACFQGYHPDITKHYGYITLAQPDGSEIPGYPLSISFLPASGKAVLTLLKKFVPLSQPTGQRGCSYYASFVFADFESATTGSIDNWIERCLFDNFQ